MQQPKLLRIQHLTFTYPLWPQFDRNCAATQTYWRASAAAIGLSMICKSTAASVCVVEPWSYLCCPAERNQQQVSGASPLPNTTKGLQLCCVHVHAEDTVKVSSWPLWCFCGAALKRNWVTVQFRSVNINWWVGNSAIRHQLTCPGGHTAISTKKNAEANNNQKHICYRKEVLISSFKSNLCEKKTKFWE